MKRALIVGPSYPAPYTIPATPVNITDWNTTLAARGFTSRTIVSGTKSRSQIQSAIISFCGSVKASDSAALVLLGHGGRVADISGDEADGYDECFAASDILPICDDWLGQKLAAIPAGAKIDVVAEMCYAGTSTKAAPVSDGPPKLDPPILPTRGIQFLTPKEKPARSSVIPKTALNHRLWAACAENELSYTCISGGQPHSIFSLYLCWALRTYPAMNAEDLIAAVAGYVTAYVPDQHPCIEGPNLTGVPF